MNQHPCEICHKCTLATADHKCSLSGLPFVEHAAEVYCPAGKFGDALAPKTQDPERAKQLLHGAIGIAKATLNVDNADKQVIAHRRAICRECPESRVSLVGLAKCRKCGCFLMAKTKLAGESCPLSKW